MGRLISGLLIGRSLVLGLMLALMLAVGAAQAQYGHYIPVRSKPIPLNTDDPNQQKIGALTYLGGLELSSVDQRFGGFSGLVIRSDGNELLAVSDRGDWWAAQMRYTDGHLTELGESALEPLLNNTLQPLAVVKRNAEALALASNGALYVAYEIDHRIELRYLPDVDDLQTALYTIPVEELDYGVLRQATPNSGIEAIALIEHRRLLALSEGLRSPGKGLKGWICEDGKAQELVYADSDDFLPVDAAVLPNGDILVLERRYTPYLGVSVRLMHVARDSIQPGAILKPRLLARMSPPINVDNMEGLAVRETSDGKLIVYMLSDDNFNRRLQRTLLMMFELDPAALQQVAAAKQGSD